MPRPARTRARKNAQKPQRSDGAGRREGRKHAGVRWVRVGLVALLGMFAVALAFWLSLPSAEALRTGDPPTTALIDARAQEAWQRGRPARRNQHPLPLARISPWLQRAVVNSEDARFYLHQGVDLVETQHALERAAQDGHLGRGASTLTQQLAKNLWLGEERSLLRKLKEYFLARRLEELGKDRILELYLNVAEWGDGIYGADAAARVWFHVPAAELSPEQAAVLAAMLPAPRKRNPRHPSPHLKARAAQVLELYGMYRQLSPAQLNVARLRLAVLLAQ